MLVLKYNEVNPTVILKVTDNRVVLIFCTQDKFSENTFHFEFPKGMLPTLPWTREQDETWMNPVMYMKCLAFHIYWYSIVLAVITILQKRRTREIDLRKIKTITIY